MTSLSGSIKHHVRFNQKLKKEMAEPQTCTYLNTKDYQVGAQGNGFIHPDTQLCLYHRPETLIVLACA